MDKRIRINVDIDPACDMPQVTIRTNKKTDLVRSIIDALESCIYTESSRITIYDSGRIDVLEKKNIIRVYIENRKLTICTASNKYHSRMSLCDFEDKLDKDVFTRISRFEMVNLKKVSSFDQSISGTIEIMFEDGSKTWVARRYVRDIQEKIKNLASRH